MKKENQQKAVFLDRDGTINIDREYLYRIEDFTFTDGAIEGMRLLREAGYLLVIITNQSGIARGYYTEQDYIRLNDWMCMELKKQGVEVAGSYYCPHHPQGLIGKYRKVCRCRKPKTGLYEQAIEELSINVEKSFAIGDRLRDCAICEHTACKGFLIGNTEDAKVIAGVKAGKRKNLSYASDLYEGARKIVSL